MISEPFLPILAVVAVCVLFVGLIFRSFKQPSVVGYIAAGLLLGPGVFNLINEDSLISQIGSLGVVLLLFFIGMEMDIGNLLKGWKISVAGAIFQVLMTTIVIYLLGFLFGFPIEIVILIGFVISLSSTAVVIKILEEWKELDTNVGRTVVGILIVQDLLVIPMIIIVGLLGSAGGGYNAIQFVGQLVLMLVIFFFVGWMARHRAFKLPFKRDIKKDHELQIFAALTVCFGFAMVTGFTGLSSALGAFLGGLLVSSSGDTKWIKKSVNPLKIVFVALFFLSIGLLIDLGTLFENFWRLAIVVGVILFLNTFINAIILRGLGHSWSESFYAGALLSQIGEFSFVLGATALASGLINELVYDEIVIIIALSLLASPLWIAFFKKITAHKAVA